MYRNDELRLSVSNQDLFADGHTDGFGITGMRRRVAHLGGRFSAGPGSHKGTYEVRVALPTSRDHRVEAR